MAELVCTVTGEGKENGKGKGRGEGREGRGEIGPPIANSWIRPCYRLRYTLKYETVCGIFSAVCERMSLRDMIVSKHNTNILSYYVHTF